MNLRIYRKNNNLTLADMAKALGFKSSSTIFKYERGRLPSRETIKKIERVTKGKVKWNDFKEV